MLKGFAKRPSLSAAGLPRHAMRSESGRTLTRVDQQLTSLSTGKENPTHTHQLASVSDLVWPKQMRAMEQRIR